MLPLVLRLKEQARMLGFDLVGIAPAVSPDGVSWLRDWLEHGHAGEMKYMERHAAAREHPRAILADVKSVVMVAMNYRTGNAERNTANELPRGRIASYAWGDDYHNVLWERLNRLLEWVQHEAPSCRGRAVVDTAPLLERDFARLAGLGWFGKNTMLLNKRLGSFFFLGALLLDIELPADEPFEANHCGTCTACLEACPTQAFVGPYQLDARRCISYLTIELRQSIPAELRPGMGNWIFGCDICQDVCPWNRKAPLSAEPAFQPRRVKSRTDSKSVPPDEGNYRGTDFRSVLRDEENLSEPELISLLRLSPEEFRQRFRGTALTRPRRSGFLRNVAIALGNSGNLRAVPALAGALGDVDPLVRGPAAWALGRLGGVEARAALEARRALEADACVQSEIDAALKVLAKA
jgi:epoxyqueuosine reductase